MTSWYQANRERAAEYAHAYYRANRDAIIAQTNRYRAANKERIREQRREYNATRNHGITRTIRDWMYESQGGACAGCGAPKPDAKLYIDHDHGCCPGKRSCGRCVRGLVCSPCNVTDVMAGVFARRSGVYD